MIDILCWVVAVLCTVTGVDLLGKAGLRIQEGHVFLDAACPDATFVANLRTSEPC